MREERPFDGIEVVEFGQFIAVPYCGQLLADGGARVIKVESLDGDPTRHIAPLAPGETRHFVSRNRGKHTLPLDLRHPNAAPVVEALLARADVVLTNFRPGRAAELGLDYGTLAPRFPRLIVGNVTAFGAHGLDAALAGMDIVIQARSGLMAATGRMDDGRPAVGEPPLADYMCAMTLAFGIASALVRRGRTGRGGEVDVALLMAALTLQNNSMVRVESVDGPVQATVLGSLAELRARGVSYDEQAATIPHVRPPGMVHVYYRTYATKDSVIALACVSPGLQRTLMRTLGLEDAAHARRIGDQAELERHYTELGKRVEALLASRTAAEWKIVFDAHGIPAAGVKLPLEMFDDAQAAANDMFHDLDHPKLGPVRLLSTPVRMDKHGFTPSPPTPPFGSDTRDILERLGFSPVEVEGLIRSGVTRGDLG